MAIIGGYNYPWRQKFTVDNTGIGALANFPLRLVSSYIPAKYCPGVRIYRQNLITGQTFLLPHEYVGSVAKGGSTWSEFFACSPAIGLGATEAAFCFWIYYGVAAPSIEDAEGVWSPDGNFIAVWHLGETEGAFSDSVGTCSDSTVHDVSDYNTIVGPQFDGSDDYISIPHHLNLETNDFTMEAFLLTNDLSSRNYIVEKGTSIAAGKYWRLNTDGSMLCLVNQSGASQQFNTAASAISTDTWYHVAAVKNGATGYLYIDGSDATDASQTLVNPDTDTAALQIGKYNTLNEIWSGRIAEVRIHDDARTADWIEATAKNFLGTYVTEYPPEYVLHVDAVSATTLPKGVGARRTNKMTLVDHVMTHSGTQIEDSVRKKLGGKAIVNKKAFTEKKIGKPLAGGKRRPLYGDSGVPFTEGG